MKTKNNKKKNGISLIVLIITIAVIIILASAVILSIANNRPIDSAKEATASHNDAVLKESAAVLSAQWEVDRLIDDSIGTRTEYVMQGLTSQGFTEEERRKIEVNDETGIVEIIGSAKEVAENPTTFYGLKIQNYIANGVAWRIFYSDSKNIYLIADDYISYEYVPSKNGTKPDKKTLPNAVTFSGILKYYNGSNDIIDSKLQNFNSKYFSYLKSNGKTSTNDNMKAVAYMLDTDVWKTFVDKYAEYAIGGPTAEMFIESYKQKYPDSQLKYNVEERTGSYDPDCGYSYGVGNGGWYYYADSVFNTSDSLYVIKDNTKAEGMWLSSPSSRGSASVCCVSNGGFLNYGDCSEARGFRPILCLKSNVILENQGENGYIIK